MRSWILPLIAVAAALVASWWHQTAPSQGVAPVNPMLWASDDWTTWTQVTREDALSRCALLDLPETRWVRMFASESLEVWHADAEWPVLPESWVQQPWRGGWLCGSPAAMDMWREQPGEMAKHWREGEHGATLMRTVHGWTLHADGWVVWRDTTSDVAADPPVAEVLVAPAGEDVDVAWWTGLGWEAPAEVLQIDAAMLREGIPVSQWATRWSGGGRWTVDNPDFWRADIEALAAANDWTVWWDDNAVIVNGDANWTWKALSEARSGNTEGTHWVGHVAKQDVVVWVSQEPRIDDDADGPLVASGPDVSLDENSVMGEVRNHRSQTRMTVRHENGKVMAVQPDGAVVWSMTSSEAPLPGGASEVDVYANGKYQAMFGLPSALHLLDVKGREVRGFPLTPSSGQWTAWSVVDYDGNRNHRYLVASDSVGLVENHRKEGERTPGWAHRPDAAIDVKSPIRHIRHLRLGSRDYIYVGRDNGQVELLKRNGAVRATTSVTVDPSHPPLFRRGATLDGTSVLFIDGDGWVREHSLSSAEEVGMSRVTRADRMEWLDIDADGLEELVTWLRGTRSAWNARNERVD